MEVLIPGWIRRYKTVGGGNVRKFYSIKLSDLRILSNYYDKTIIKKLNKYISIYINQRETSYDFE